jgi:hypothetical protein
VFYFGGCAFPNGLGELSQFFAEPGNGWGNPSFSIAVAIGGVDDILKFAEVHTMTVVRTVIPIFADGQGEWRAVVTVPGVLGLMRNGGGWFVDDVAQRSTAAQC